MPVSSSTEHWIKPDALTINLNHFGDPDYLQVSVLAGAVVMAFKQDVIGYNAAHNYRTWPLEAANTYLETTSAYNVYARLTRSEVNARALVVYDTVLRDIEGREITYSEDGSEFLGEANPDYFFLFLGQFSASVNNNGESIQREWNTWLNTGSLQTNQQQNDLYGGFERMFRPHYDDPLNPDRITWIEALSHLGVIGGVTMFVDNGKIDLPSIYASLPIDGKTIYWDNGVLKALYTSGGGEADSVAWNNIKDIPSWITNTKPTYSYSEIDGTPDLSKYALVSQIPSLDGYATESWVTNKGYATQSWVLGKGYATPSDIDTRINALINGAPSTLDTLKEIADVLQENVNSIGDIITTLGTKADKATTLSGYGITDAYTKTAVNDLLKGYVTIAGTEDVTGVHDFVNGLKVGGIKLYKSQDDVIYIDGNLAVRGAVTMYADDGSVNVGTIYDGLPIDGTTIYWETTDSGKVLKAKVGTEGGVTDVNYDMVIAALGFVPYDSSNPNGYTTQTWVQNQGYLTEHQDLSGYQPLITTSNKLPYSLISGTPTSLKNPYALTFGSKTYDGSEAKTITASDLGALTAHQTIYNLTMQAGAFTAVTFDPNGAAKTVNIPTTTSHISEGSNLYFTNARATGAITGGASTIATSNLTASRALISNSSGKVAVSAVTSTELGYLDGVTSAIQTQLNARVTLSGTQTITGEKNFTGGLKVNGSPIVYDATNKYWKLEGDLIVTGGVTMFASDTSFTPSTIMDAITVDGVTLSKEDGVLKVIGGGSGITDITKEMVIGALGYTPYNATNPNGYITSYTDTKNTAGSTNSSSKLFLIGATSQAANPQTYSHDTAYVGTDGCLYSGGSKVLTAHQSIYALTIKNSAGTTQLTYTPNSGAGSITLTKAMVGLGNVENTALSTWAGTSKITTLGTITTGTWNGTKIANSYLANSSITISGTSVSLGGSITQAALRTALGLGSNAYSSTAYLPLSGGTLSGSLNIGAASNTAYNYLLFVRSSHGLRINNTDTEAFLTFGAVNSSGSFTQEKTIRFGDGGLLYSSDGNSSWKTIWHSGNFTPSNYLPLSGGTLTGSLTINRDHPNCIVVNNTRATSTSKYTAIRFQIGGTHIAGIGVYESDNSLRRINSDFSKTFKIWDEDNDGSGSGLDADLLDGSHANDLSVHKSRILRSYNDTTLDNPGLKCYYGTIGQGETTDGTWCSPDGAYDGNDYGSVVRMVHSATYYTDIFLNANKSNIKYRQVFKSVSNGWKTIATLTDNVASATKLATARTIWGQSFDGTGNITGYLRMLNNTSMGWEDTNATYQNTLYLSSNNNLRLGYGTSAAGYNTYIDGNQVSLTYGTSHTVGLALLSSGRISAKGNIDIPNNKAIYFKNSSATDINSLYFDNSNILHLGYGTSGSYYTKIYGNQVYLHYGSRSVGMILNNSGNITIGSSDSASTTYKMYVSGKLATTGDMFLRTNATYLRGVLADGTETNLLGVNANNSFLIGYGQRLLGTTTYHYGGLHAWYYGTAGSSAIGMYLNTNGNVTIGASDLAGTSSKLYVDGIIKTSGNIICQSTSNVVRHITVANDVGSTGLYVATSGNRGLYDFNNNYWIIYTDGTNTISSTKTHIQRSNVVYHNNKMLYWYQSDNATSMLTLYVNASNALVLGKGTAQVGGATYLDGNVIYFRYGKSNTTGMYLSSSGNVGIGTTSMSAKLHVAGDILATGGITMQSARKLKNVIDERGLSLEELRAIKPTRFTWKDGRDNKIHIGGIADDVMKVLPEVIYKTTDDTLTMDYGNAAFAISASLIKPMIDHEQRIKLLEEENKRLKEEIEILKWNIA